MLPLTIYYAHFETLNGIRFTPREVDIIACILNGRSAKTIPSLLSISSKTVAAHLENIRSKASCSSRESIIDFIEASKKCALIKNEYYQSLLNYIFFEKCLCEFSKIIASQGFGCSLIYEQSDKVNVHLVQHLKQHLKLVGLKIENKSKKGQVSLNRLIHEIDSQQEKYILYIPADVEQFHKSYLEVVEKKSFIEKAVQTLNRIVVLFPNNKYSIKDKILQCVSFSESENYYFSFFQLLQIICPHKSLDKVFNDFKHQIQLNHPISQNSYTLTPSNRQETHAEILFKKIHAYLPSIFLGKRSAYVSTGIIFLLGILLSYHLLTKEENLTAEANIETTKTSYAIRSDLVLPVASSFLNRSELISQMKNKLKGEKGIQSLALIGIGGAGKTTLARQYAQQQKANVIWELNAETRGDLNRSFEKLATVLSKAEQDARELRGIQGIKNSQEREEKLIHFVKTRLKAISNWFLVFDNVETLASIQNHFPQDMNTWGVGKIILTTRDHNFQNSSHINQVLFVGELNKAEKLDLFIKIMNLDLNEPFTVAQREEASRFLDNIPPFPLDISVAAYYLKSTHSSYPQYLEHIKKHKEKFENFQFSLLKEHGSYSKTRYGIITLSLKEIIAKSKDFSELLLFISLVNSQNIPRDLLEKYADPIVVANFIYHLKKYSLIINNSLLPCNSMVSLSLHHSTQDISLPYLLQQLDLSKGSPLFEKIANTIDDYMDQAIEQEEFPKMKMMARHLEKFLDHSDLLTDLSKGLLESKLGSIYYFINDNKARKTLEASYQTLNMQNLDLLSPEDNSRIARSFLHIGAVYTELKRDKEAEKLFEKAINIYRQEKVKNYLDLSWVLSHLGNVHRRMGDYEQARADLEESMLLQKQYESDKKRIARTLAYLGGAYRGILGYHQKAIKCLEESLMLHHKNFPQDHFRVGWILAQLGNLYRDLGDPKKAKEYFEASLLIFKKNLPENHISIGLTLAYLGNCYRELNDYEKSRNYLEQSEKIHQKHFEGQHVRRGWILFHLANTYKNMGNQKKYFELYNEVIEIYSRQSNNDNIQNVRLLREMAQIYLGKSQLDKAEHFIKRALKILQDHNYVDTYKALEILGGIYLQKSMQSLQIKNSQESQDLKNIALATLQQALKITEQTFPKNSLHIARIRYKIKHIKNNIEVPIKHNIL